MGQAKQRGTFEQRKEQAIKKSEEDYKNRPVTTGLNSRSSASRAALIMAALGASITGNISQTVATQGIKDSSLLNTKE